MAKVRANVVRKNETMRIVDVPLHVYLREREEVLQHQLCALKARLREAECELSQTRELIAKSRTEQRP
jgi:hypothetical protein